VRYGKVNFWRDLAFSLEQPAVDEEPALVGKAQFVAGSGDGVTTAVMQKGYSIHSRPSGFCDLVWMF